MSKEAGFVNKVYRGVEAAFPALVTDYEGAIRQFKDTVSMVDSSGARSLLICDQALAATVTDPDFAILWIVARLAKAQATHFAMQSVETRDDRVLLVWGCLSNPKPVPPLQEGCDAERADTHDPVNRPKHYTSHPSGTECITVTEHMGFNVGNAIKYLWRADEKGNALEDLRKAAWYVNREIEKRLKADAASATVKL